jgi:glycosyltransferase involved in cell wall biosynthesis/acetyltransferase-like isoleucine patch superfamily enzyme
LMKILYLITRAERGGAQIHVADLLRASVGRLDVSVACGERDGYLADEARAQSIPFYWISGLVQPISLWSDASALMQTVALLREIKPDLIHAHTSKAGFISRIAGKITKIPVVFTAHTWSFAAGISTKQRMISLPLERLAARLPGRIITVSEANRRMALDCGIANELKMSTVWNGVPDTDLRSDVGEQGPVQVIMVARFAAQKNHELLLRALAQTSTAAFHLSFVGDGPTQPRVKALCDELGLRQRVTFLGDRGDVAALLARSQIFALSTNWEGLPYSILEAMRAGLPVVATDVGGVHECVLPNETGYLCVPGSVESLRDSLNKLLADAALRQVFGKAGRLLYEHHFTLDAMANRTHEVYVDTLRDLSALPSQLSGEAPIVPNLNHTGEKEVQKGPRAVKLFTTLKEIISGWIYLFIFTSGGSFVRKARLKKLGARTKISPTVFFKFPEQIEIGNDTFINHLCSIWASENGPITIGNDVLFGPCASVISSNHGIASDALIREQPGVDAAIEIQDDVWIGANVVVTGGVTIGRGCVVGAGAVVTRDLPPMSICVGVPAAPIGYRQPGKPTAKNDGTAWANASSAADFLGVPAIPTLSAARTHRTVNP